MRGGERRHHLETVWAAVSLGMSPGRASARRQGGHCHRHSDAQLPGIRSSCPRHPDTQTVRVAPHRVSSSAILTSINPLDECWPSSVSDRPARWPTSPHLTSPSALYILSSYMKCS